MPFTVVIPARYASTRLPGKPLQDIAGKTMIERVWQQACLSDAQQVIIATDHEKIRKVAKGFGATVCMTREDHESGTDRLQEVAQKMQLDEQAVIVNVQGDEPLIPPAIINQVAGLMQDKIIQMATLYELIGDPAQVFDPNTVKLVSDSNGRALYFSRAPIPWYRDGFGQSRMLPDSVSYKRHIGIYAYRVDLLRRFVSWPPGELEQSEKLEQLRVLGQGVPIQVAEACETVPGGVDTREDLEKVQALLEVR